MTRKTAREIAIQLGFAAAATGEAPQELLDRFFAPEHYESLAQEDELYAQLPDEKQMEYVRKLQALSHYNPDEACMQLFQGLIGDSGYKRGEVRLQNLSDLVNWLQDRVETLDQDVDALMRDSTFCAWLSFQGLGDVVEQIERKMGV